MTAPLAGRVGDLLSLDEGKILWTLAMTGPRSLYHSR
jgi:hypothetical protein